MNEERWHNFAKEKPSEDMEGRNFIVSNGHYEKIATWCGYWENEPFMGDHLCDEVVRWKFYFTPEEEKANEATRTEPKPMKCDELKQVEYPIEWGLYYDKAEVDAAIAELKDKIQMHDFFWEGCGFEKRGFKNTIAVSEAFDRLEAENAELKQKLEDVQASHYAEMVDAGMRERRLRRAFYKACANWAHIAVAFFSSYVTKDRWRWMERKCLKKEEEYK